jgi:hypothetical protein
MRKLIAVVAMSLFVLLAVNSSNVFAESPNDKILKKLDQIQNTLDNQVIPKLDQCCLECPEAGVPKTGQTTTYGPGDDGALQKGVVWPKPRFTDNGNGTVTDNLTGLIWLKDANCFGEKTWDDALSASNTLASGMCNLTDGSKPGEWRLPNIKELQSLLDFGQYNPALTLGHPFIGGIWTPGDRYWSSTTYSPHTGQAWYVEIHNGVTDAYYTSNIDFVWPVRDAK